MDPKDNKTPSKGGARLIKHTAPQKPVEPIKEKPAEANQTPAPKGKPKVKRAKGARRRAIKEKWLSYTIPQRVGLSIFVLLTFLSAIIVITFLLWNLLVRAPELPTTVAPEVTSSLGAEDEGEEPAATATPIGDRKDNVWTFLVVGRDTYGGGNTDTILVVTYDIDNQDLNVMSIPRDTIVNVPWDIKKINSVYNFAYYYDKDGMDYLKEVVAETIGFTPDFTVTVEWEALGELVDAIGGVYFDVPQRMYYNDLSQNFIINLQAGYQLLDGDQAMQLVRYRYSSDDSGNVTGGYTDGDLGRIAVQQDFLQAVVEECLSFNNITKINELANVFFDNVTTELSISNLAWFAQQAVFGGLTMDHVTFTTMPWLTANNVYSRSYNNYQSYVAVDVDNLLTLVNESYNPYLEDITADDLDVIMVDSNGKLTATSGYVEDTQANSAVPVATPTPSEEPEVEDEEGVEPDVEGEDTADTTDTDDTGETTTPDAETTPAPTATPTLDFDEEPQTTPETTDPVEPEETTTPEVEVTPEPTPTPTPTVEAESGPGMVPTE